MVTENKMKPSKKRTPSLQSNMEDVHCSVMFWGCCAASVTGCLECLHGIMKSGDYQGILERNVQPIVRKLGLRRRSWVLQDNDPEHLKKNPGMVQDKTLDCFEVESNESRSKSH